MSALLCEAVLILPLYMARFHCVGPTASHACYHAVKIDSSKKKGLIHKNILDNQDFGLTTEAQPQTAGRAVTQFMSACH